MTIAKKTLSVFMSLVLAITLAPFPAWGMEGGETLRAAEPSADELISGEPSIEGLYVDRQSGQSGAALSIQEDGTYKDDSTGLEYGYVEQGGSICITSVTARDALPEGDFELTFPKSIGEKSVTQLGLNESNLLGFYGVGEATSMTIPNTVTSIHLRLAVNEEYRYFYDLGTVTFESGSALTTLPDAVFAYSDVRNVTLPESLNAISEGLFYSCSFMMGISLPSAVTSIGKNAFAGCTNLTRFTIPSQVQSIGETAFADCVRLRSIDVPPSVQTIGKGAFTGCSSLADLTLHDGLRSIGDCAFFNCVSIDEVVFPSTLLSIGASAFSAGSDTDHAGEYDMAYSSISIPDSVESIGAYAFVNSKLTSVQLGTSQASSHLRTLGECAFALSSISEITLPNSLESMGNVDSPEVTDDGMVFANGAFRHCQALSKIVWPETSSMTSAGGFDGCTALPDSVLANLPAYFTSIAPGAFADCAFEDIYIPSTITSIGAYAFALSDQAEDALESITFAEEGEQLTIGKRAFAKEHNGKGGMVLKVSEVVFPERVTGIGVGAFSGIVLSDEAKTTKSGAEYRYYEGPTYKIYNPDVVLGNGGTVFGTDDYEWPFSPAEGVTICYPKSVAGDASILAFQNAVQIYEDALDAKCADPADEMYGMTFNHTTFAPIDVPVRHRISGTVPAGAAVTLFIDDEEVDATPSGTAIATRQVVEASVVGALVSLDGFEPLNISPEEGKSRALLDADWTIDVKTADLTPLSNMGSLQVTVKKGLSGDAEAAAVNGCNVAIFDSSGALAAQGAVSETGVFLAQELAAGSYTVVGFDHNGYFSAVSSTDDFASLGLSPSDYARANATVIARQANALDLSVPDMDTNKLEGPVALRSVYLTTAHVVPTCVFYARVSYTMNEGHDADALTVKVPHGMEVVLARTANENYGIGGFDASTRTLTLSSLDEKDRQASEFYLGLKVTTAGSYNISASITSGSSVVPLGSADIEAPALALQAPSDALGSTTFDAVVYAPPRTKVSFAVGNTPLSATATTNNLGSAKVSLTIPEGELSSYSYYLLQASTGDGAAAEAVLNYEYSAEQMAATVQQLSFHHAGKEVYLVKDGQDVAGGYYTCLVVPSSHAALYSPTWPFTAVIDSARPLDSTITLKMETLDSNIRYEEMRLSNTQNLNDGAGTKRYTYTASVRVGTGVITDNLKSSDIPRAFDILFTYDPDAEVSAPSQAVLETIKARALKTRDAWVADLRIKTGKAGLGADDQRAEDIEDLLFNGGFKHEQWSKEADNGDLIWSAVLTEEDRAKYLQFENYMSELVSTMGKGYGGKSLDRYGNAKSFLADVAGYREGQSATKESLKQQGYTIVDNGNASTWNAQGYHAPSWYATRAATQDDRGQGSLMPQDDFEQRLADHYYYYQDSLGFMVGDGITYAAVNTGVNWGSVALESSRASVAIGAVDGIQQIDSARVTKMKDEAQWLVEQTNKGNLNKADWSYFFQRDCQASLNESQIQRIADGGLDSLSENRLMQKFNQYSGPVGDALTVVGTASGIAGVAQSSAELTNVRDRRETVNGEIDAIDIQLQALRREGRLSSDLGRAYLQEQQAAIRYRAMFDDDEAVLTFDSLYGSLTTVGGATQAGGEASWAVSEGWELLKANCEYQDAQVREQIKKDYEQARLKRKQEQDIAADQKRQEEALRYLMQPIMDPSGYVYAGVDGNRLEGVVATIYQVVTDATGAETRTEWAASEYNQVNNQVTGAGGLYGWDVPQGTWRILFHKDGYEDQWSDAMDTPPEWTNVAINLLATDARVESIARSGDFAIVKFAQYMKLSAAPTVKIGGATIAGTWTDAVEGVNESKNIELMGRTMRVAIPASAKGQTVEITVSGGKSYAGKNLTAASARISVPSDAPATPAVSTQAMYRLYNRYSGEHFYTASASERDQLKAIGWNDEGRGWTAPAKSATPVYRLYNRYAGDHHYTTSASERDTLKAAGWSYEGVGWYSDDSKKVPLYRQYNPYATTGSHNYTTSKAENDQLVKLGWRAEGVGWYGV